MKLNDFFYSHPVFTVEELDEYLDKYGSRSPEVRSSMLSYHRCQGRIIPVRRGLYAVVPPGMSPESAPVDPFLIAAKMTGDACLAYHTALEFHGRAYSVFNYFYYLTSSKSQPGTFRSFEFRPVLTPKALRERHAESFGIKESELSGLAVRVTTLERTLVDVLDRPDISGGWEEIWRSLEMVEYFNLEEVVEYTHLLNNSTTAAKVGFFLEQHKETLMVDSLYLERLQNMRPQKPHYLDRSRRQNGKLMANWNLVVPESIINRSWAEVT